MKDKRVVIAVVLIVAIVTVINASYGITWGIAAFAILGGSVLVVLLLAPKDSKEKAASQSPEQGIAEDTPQQPEIQAPATALPNDVDEFEELTKEPDHEEPETTTVDDEHDAIPEVESILQANHEASFSYDTFTSELLRSGSPMEYLDGFCESVAQSKTSTSFERYFAKRLSEADIADLCEKEGALPFDVILTRHSHTFYIREAPRISYGHHLQVLMVEAALNAMQFAFEYFDDPLSMEEEEFVRLEQRHTSSICAQLDDVNTSDWSYLAMPWQSSVGPSHRGEWSVRSALSESIETFRIPYRLEATFRCNVSGGDVAIEFSVTPSKAFPRSSYTDGLGVVPTTSHMRSRMASDYAARMAILLTNAAFQSSERIRRVWVAGTKTTPSTKSCMLWAKVDRRTFARVHMGSIRKPLDVLSRLGATTKVEAEVLQPVEQGFYLEDSRFCPAMRHDLWKLSERSLPPSAAVSMASPRVSDLRIHEELLRSIAAEEAASMMPGTDGPNATQASVRSVLAAANMTSDIDVWCAAERVARKLVDGTLSATDPIALQEEFVAGDFLSKAVIDAQRLLAKERANEALSRLDEALRAIDSLGSYEDTDSVVYRSFDTFTQRVVYNRLTARDARCIILVPDAYVTAHLLASTILLSRAGTREYESQEDIRRALHHARQALRVAPLSTPAAMCTVACNEAMGDIPEAADVLNSTLELAHEPQDIALAYYRMASMQWNLNHHEACLACYQLAASTSPMFVPVVLAECHALSKYDELLTTPMDTSEVVDALRNRKIPLAPTQRMSYLLYDCAAASVDAEVFPVARDLLRILESFTGDDVIRGIRNSLEREPDA